MAFTVSEIEKALSGQVFHFSAQGTFSAHANYAVVVDYLTSQTPSLQGLTQTPENYQLILLVPLVENVEAPTEKDRRLLDVLMHPDVLPYVRHHLFNHLALYVLKSDTDAAVQAVVGLCRQAGFQKQELTGGILRALYQVPFADAIIQSATSPVKKFLLENLPANLLTNQQAYHAIGGWNPYLFALAEETQPQLVRDLLVLGLSMKQPGITSYLLRHKNGVHIPRVAEWADETAVWENELQAKFFTAIQLHEETNGEHNELLLRLAKRYLEAFRKTGKKQHWEAGVHLPQFKDTDYSYLGYSAVAVHFLLQHDEAAAKEMISEWFDHKIFVPFNVLRMMHVHLKEEALPYLRQGLGADTSVGGIDYYRSIVNLLVKEFTPDVYLDIIWGLAATKSKPLCELIAKIITENDAEAEGKAIRLLANKNAETRQTGALILRSFSSEAAINAVKSLLDKETNDATRDLFLSIAGEHLPATAGKAFIDEMVASAKGRGKLAKPVEAWLMEDELPPLFYQSGELLTAEETRFLLYRMSRVKAMRSDAEAKYIVEQLDKERSVPFAKQLLRLYIEKGAKPEQKYLLALAALLGGEDVVDKIRSITNAWIEEKRIKMAEYGVGALALQGSDKALRWVEWYSRKYKTKKANVGAAALQALEDAAEEQGITVHELGDRVVPDFGFDGLYKEFDAAGETYRAFIDGSFKLCFFNEEAKKLKALPAAAPAAVKEEFKAIGKEVRDVVKSQSGRMEYYLLVQRKWKAEAWKNFFLNNPVMFIYATKLLWAVYEDGRLTLPFFCLEDTSLLNLHDDEIEINDNASIGIVHPLDLAEEQRQAWKRKFFDLSIESIFPQLDRSVSLVGPDEGEQKIIRRFEEKATQSGAVTTTLERYGWRKGAAGDGGSIDSFSLTDEAHNRKAVLEVDGVFAGGFGYDGEARLGRLYFINPEKDTGRWFQSPKDERDERLIALKDLPPVFYSEVMLNIGSIKLKDEAKEI